MIDNKHAFSYLAAVAVFLLIMALVFGLDQVERDRFSERSHSEHRVLVLSGEAQKASLAGWMDLLVDPEGTLSIDDIPDLTESAGFVPQASFGSGGFTRDVHWYRFTVMRIGEAPRRWILEMGPPYLNDIRVFVPTERGEISEVALGDHVPFARRPVKSRLHALALDLPEGEPTTVYVRLQSTSVLAFIATLRTPESAIADGGAANFFYGVFFGTLVIAVLVNAVFGVWLRDSAMRTYAFYVATLFVHYLAVNGFAAMVVPNDPPWLIDALTGISVLGAVASLAFVWDRFVNAKENFPRIHWLFMALAAYCLLGIPLTPTHWYGLWAGPAHYAAQGIIPFGMILVAILLRRNGPDAALVFYLLGFSASLFGVFVYISSIHGLIPLSEFTNNSFQISALFHVILLSIGLAYRVRNFNLERAEAHQRAAVADQRAREQIASKQQLEQSLMRERRMRDEQGRFIDTISHEYRTPLSIVRTSLDIIYAKQQIDERRFGVITSALSRLENIFSDALRAHNLGRPPPPKFAAIDLKVLLDEALNETRQDEPNCPFDYRPAPDNFNIFGDAGLIFTVLRNLLGNAAKYRSRDPVSVTLRRAGEQALLVVDNAIDSNKPLDCERLFERFERGSSVSDKSGMGLGLYLVRRIVHDHAGEVAIATAPSDRFIITLKLPLFHGDANG